MPYWLNPGFWLVLLALGAITGALVTGFTSIKVQALEFDQQTLAAGVTTVSNFQTEQQKTLKTVAYPTDYQDDPELEQGIEQVLTQGVTGQTEVVTTTTYYKGEVYDIEVEEQVISEPTPQVIARGTKIIPKVLQTPQGEITFTQKLDNFFATSYDSTCRGCSTVTATGMKQGTGVVAVDPKVIPLYTKLYIPGYGNAIAGDVGGAVKGKRIDLGYDSLMGQWSAHYVDVYVLAEQ